MEFRPSRRRFYTNYLISAFLLIILIIARIKSVNTHGLDFLVFVIAILFIGDAEGRIWYYRYLIDDEKIDIISGIFSRNTVTIPYHAVSRVELNESVIGRLLNFGDIVIYPHSGQRIVLLGLVEPHKVYDFISDKLSE